MSKAVLISIRPKWCELIASGKKTIEVRKTAPRTETPFKCYIYETRGFERVGNDNLNCVVGGSGRGAVIGEFVCDKIDAYDYEYCTHPEIGMDYDCGDNWFCIDDVDLEKACLTYKEFRDYAGNKDVYGWHISELVVYDEPKKLSEFYRWYDGITDIRPCENGKPCDHLVFDYSEDHEACGIDYDGENCPFLKVTRPPQSYCYVEELP